MNVLGNILNATENFQDQEDYGFTASFFQNCRHHYRWILKKEIDVYATCKFHIPEKYRKY